MIKYGTVIYIWIYVTSFNYESVGRLRLHVEEILAVIDLRSYIKRMD